MNKIADIRCFRETIDLTPELAKLKIEYREIRQARSRVQDEIATYYFSIGVNEHFEALKQLSLFNLNKSEELAGTASNTELSQNDNDKSIRTGYSDSYDQATTDTLYKIWSQAVNDEIDLFDRFSVVAATADDEVSYSWLLTVCRDALENAKSFRQKRRVAFHINRKHHQSTAFPKLTRISTVTDFAFTVSAVENWVARMMVFLIDDFPHIEGVITETKKKNLELKNYLDGYPLPKQLRVSVGTLNNADISNFAYGNSRIQKKLKLIAECERVFDYYDLIFSSIPDEQVMEEAQSMSVYSLRRLQKLRSLDIG